MTDSVVRTEPKTYFFVVSPLKFIVMSATTFGLYDLWWNFKNWLAYQELTDKKVAPFWRAWFSVFYLYPLLREMRKYGESKGFMAPLATGPIFTAWLFIEIFNRVMSKVEGPLLAPMKEANPLMGGCLGVVLIFLGLLSFIPLLFAQKYVNDLNLTLNPNCHINNEFTKGNWIFIAIGCTVIGLAIYGSFI